MSIDMPWHDAVRCHGRRMGRSLVAALLVALSTLALCTLAPATLPAQERALDWPSIAVTAHLDADGRLHVRERQVIRFTGDWNGGERMFNLRNDQSIELRSMSRVDSVTGNDVAMVQGDLSTVNNFDWTDSRTVRWRSRHPLDSVYDNTVIGFVLDYVYSNILVPNDDGSYTLDHDFAFPDREGAIAQFTLALTLDTLWSTTVTVPPTYAQSDLQPGESYTVTLPLTFLGTTPPGSVVRAASATVRRALAAAFGGGVLLLLISLVVREHRLGRFTPIISEDRVTASWLEQHVFNRLPEVVGAAWDDQTSSAEVAATLARLVQEGKLTSKVISTKRMLGTKDVLHLTIPGDRQQFTGHERSLINALFTSGSRSTDTESVRRHYRTSGFDPAQLIRKPLEALVDQAAPGQARTAPSRWPTAIILLAAMALTIFGMVKRPSNAEVAVALLLGAVPVYLVAIGLSAAWRTRVHRFTILTMMGLVPIVGMVYVVCVIFLLQGTMRMSALVLGGIALWYFGLIHSIVNMARSRQSAERIQLRKQLTSARNYFRAQLAQPQPQLNDAWFPYLIAFGLGRHIDKWFRAFGGENSTDLDSGFATAKQTTGMSSSMSSSSGSSGGWTGFGGGGGFSGAGGGASFASAIGGMAASVAAPSSSSSGGGSSSSSSSSSGSSGGGGGGGW